MFDFKIEFNPYLFKENGWLENFSLSGKKPLFFWFYQEIVGIILIFFVN